MRCFENVHTALDLQAGNDDGRDGGRRTTTDGPDRRNGRDGCDGRTDDGDDGTDDGRTERMTGGRRIFDIF